MTKEALKLALEALELHGKQYPHMVKGYCLDAITAIKEALANEALEKMAENARELGLDYEPPQRTWVGLTEAQCGVLWKTNMTPFEYYQAIEAKLKEKNT